MTYINSYYIMDGMTKTIPIAPSETHGFDRWGITHEAAFEGTFKVVEPGKSWEFHFKNGWSARLIYIGRKKSSSHSFLSHKSYRLVLETEVENPVYSLGYCNLSKHGWRGMTDAQIIENCKWIKKFRPPNTILNNRAKIKTSELALIFKDKTNTSWIKTLLDNKTITKYFLVVEDF